MKRVKSFIVAILIAFVVGFVGIATTFAASSLPSTFKTADLSVNGKYKTVNYINAKDANGKSYTYPIIVKKTTSGKYVYCMELDSTYGYSIEFAKKSKVDDGFIYIIEKDLGLSDADKAFYIKQLATWYYMDYVNGNNANLEVSLKNYIIYHAQHDGSDNHEVCKAVIDLLEGAISYKQTTGSIDLVDNNITFSIVGDYYVSSEIVVNSSNVSNIKYTLENTPSGSKVTKSDNGVIVKIPTSAIAAGKKLTFTLKVTAGYEKKSAYYYYANSKYQKLLYSDVESETISVSDSITMTIANVNYTVNISKTDVTQAKEVAGATFVVKDESGKEVETWVSTTETHKITLTPGKYTLTETIAPTGYKLSSTTISFMVATDGTVYVKDDAGVYNKVTKVVMINELIDQVSIAKLDTDTKAYVAGAKLAIKDSNGYVVKEFTTTDGLYTLELNEGVYTLYEVEAPEDYELSTEVVTFQVTADGSVQVQNSDGSYSDVTYVTFYNKKKTIVEVPSTGKNATLIILGGLALLIGGAFYAKKSIKEC